MSFPSWEGQPTLVKTHSTSDGRSKHPTCGAPKTFVSLCTLSILCFQSFVSFSFYLRTAVATIDTLQTC